jgi:hypothetical protein
VGEDNKPRYIKFQAFPCKVNGPPENEGAFLPREEEMLKPWNQTGGYNDPNRPYSDYLSTEVRNRIDQKQEIKFELRAQLWEREEKDEPEILSVNAQWVTDWISLGEIEIENYVSSEEGLSFAFPVGIRTKTKVIELPDLDNGWNGASKYASLLYAREEIYNLSIFLRKWRAILFPKTKKNLG